MYPYLYVEGQRSHAKSINQSELVCVIRLDSRTGFPRSWKYGNITEFQNYDFQTRESNCLVVEISLICIYNVHIFKIV